MAATDPISHKDPLYAELAGKVEQKLGLPVGLVRSIIQDGERTDADKVSSAGARHVGQFIPATRDSMIKKYGVDPWLSADTAVESIGLLLKENLARSGGDVEQAVREYHGGLDPKAWGPVNNAYWGRVSRGFNRARTDALGRDFASFLAANPAVPAGQSAAAVAPAGQASAPAPAQAAPQDQMSASFGNWLQGQAAGPQDIPTEPGANTAPTAQPAPSLGEQLLGLGETGLALATGATTGALGALTGAAGGLGRAIVDGSFGTPEAARAIQAASEQGASNLTYEPRTGAGREMAGAVGQALGATLPVAALSGEMAALARAGVAAQPSAAAAATAARPAATAAAQAARNATQIAAERVGQVLGRSPADVATPEAAAAQAATPVPRLSPQDLAKMARSAADGGLFSGPRATRVLASQAMPDEQVVAAAQRLGIADYLQPDHVTTNQAFRELSQAVKSIPSSQARALEIQGLERVSQRASALIDELGGSRDLSTLNQEIKTSMQATQKQLEQQADALYTRIRAEIPQKTEAPAQNVLAFIERRADELGGRENLTPMERRILGRLSPKTTTITEKIVAPEVPVGLMLPRQADKVVTREVVRQPTYTLLDDVRREVGSATSGRGPFKDADSGLAKALYQELTRDQELVVGKHGATELLSAAKSAVAVRKGLEDDLISLFGKTLDGSLVQPLISGVEALPKGNTSGLIRLLKAIPESQRQRVMASGLESAFRTSVGKGEPISFAKYARWYEGLQKNRQAYTAVMANLPAPARQQLGDLYRVSKGISKATSERITTGRIGAVKEMLGPADTLVGRLFDIARRGTVGATVGTAASLVAGPGIGGALAAALTKGAKTPAVVALDSVLLSPEFLGLIRTPEGPARAAAVRRLANSRKLQKFILASGSPRDASERKRQILSAIEGRSSAASPPATPRGAF